MTTNNTATEPTFSAAITLVGNLGREIERKEFDSGKMVARSSLAVSQGKDKEPRWVNVEAWQALANRLVNTCGKGQRVALTGFLAKETFEGRDGQTRTVEVLRIQWIDKIQVTTI